MIAWIRNSDTLITVNGIRTLNRSQIVLAGKAKRELGFRPRPFEETIRDAVTWYREFQPEKLK
ncbi:MAG: hypothetical protein U0175_36865 [Caldilineaceae bacterium]